MFEPPPGPRAERAVNVLLGRHVVLDEPLRSLGDEAVERFECGRDVVLRIDRFADVVQKSREQELLVVGKRITGVVEHLEAVIERVPFGMIFEILLHIFQRQKQALIDLKPIELLSRVGHGRFQVQIGIFPR